MGRYKRTTLIIIGCIGILLGLVISRKAFLDVHIWLLIFTPALLLLKNKNFASLLMVILLGLSLGLWRGGIYMQKLQAINSLNGHKVHLNLVAKNDAVYGKNSQVEFIGSDINLLSPSAQPLVGNFKISGFGVPMVYRGDKVDVSGKLFLMRGSNQARISYASLQVVQPGNNLLGKIARNFSSGMENALPEPAASFGLGLLAGQRTNLPSILVAELTAVGLVHIVAVSGYNLTILVRAAQRLRIKSKYQRTILALLMIFTFVLITGFSASIVRAAIVSVLSLWAWYFGRALIPMLIIFFTAALTALLNPFYIWSDIGWYLSFLAFFGVLVVAPIITKTLFTKTPPTLTLVLIETMSAEIMTIPVIMMVFGQVSLVGVLGNLLIVPLIPLAMLLCSIAGIAGLLIPEMSGWFAWPAKILLTYILDLVHTLSTIPHAVWRAGINPTIMIILYTVVALAMIIISRKISKNQLTKRENPAN